MTVKRLEDLEDTKEHKHLTKPKRSNDTIRKSAGYMSAQQIYEAYFSSEPRGKWSKKARRARMERALVAAEYVTALRISELLSVKKEQVEKTEDWLVFKSVHILKQKPDKYLDKALPRKGTLAPFTKIVEEHIDSVDSGLLFPISRQQAYRIVHRLTGQWNHYFRAQGISYLVNDRGLPTLAVKELTGHKSMDSLAGYAVSSYKQHPELLK